MYICTNLLCCYCYCCEVASVVSDSVRPHRRQPTRLPHPWDSPGKNTGVGCHFLLQCMKVKSESEVAQSCPTLRPHGLQPTRLLRPWDFPGKRTRVGCHIHLQSRNRVTDVENKLAVTKERNGVMNWRIGIDIYTPLCIKGITIEPLLYSKGNSSQCSVVA